MDVTPDGSPPRPARRSHRQLVRPNGNSEMVTIKYDDLSFW
jgi:hypothetical protein